MVIDPLHLIGAGGQGRVAYDALLAAGVEAAAIVVRDGRAGLSMLGRAVVVPEVVAAMAGQRCHVAIGSAAIRATFHAAAIAIGARPVNIVHPAATLSLHVTLGEGVMAAAGAVIAPGVTVGDGTIVNHHAIVDHDCRVGHFCHVAPNAVLGGGVAIGDRVFVGAGAVILPELRIADDVVIGAGAVVVCAIGEAGTWVGNPARRLTA